RWDVGDGLTPSDESRSAESPRRQTDRLLSQHKKSLARFARDMQRLLGDLGADHRALDETAQRIDAEVRRMRMLPFAEACEGLDRMVRDLAASVGKMVNVIIDGGEIEIDRSVLEGLKDPLIHLVRNSVDHGIETVAARRASGKPEMGCVIVAAAIRAGRLEVT